MGAGLVGSLFETAQESLSGAVSPAAAAAAAAGAADGLQDGARDGGPSPGSLAAPPAGGICWLAGVGNEGELAV